MFRSTLIAAGAVLLCSTGYSQQQLDPAKIHPITAPVRDAGVFNWGTKQWVSGPKADRLKAAPYFVFDNTCTWTGGGFYYGHEHCEDVIDTGRIPGASTPLKSLEGSPQQLNGPTDDQIINNFQFSYCTFWVTGTVDIKVGFYDNLRGDCAAGIPTSPPTLSSQAIPFGTLTAYFDFGSASGFPLPGSTVNGNQSCWIITVTFPNNGGFCMQSEGDGTWDNAQQSDLFSWSFEHGNPNSVWGANGPIISGEAASGGWGAGSYNLPQGTDAIFGNKCGTGFGTSVDGWWLNIDGSGPGIANTVVFPNNPAKKATCVGASAFGTNCYWFGGWPANPLGSFWMVMGSVGSCDDCNNRAVNYCTAGTTANNCNALISAQGTSSATASTGFFLQANNIEGNKDGTFFWGTNGRQAVPWKGGNSFQCVVPPVKRGGTIVGTGTNGLCDGVSVQDLNQRWFNKPAQNPGAGAVVQAQFWFRDPPSPGTTSISDAIEWTVCP